jgi:hypothetical protein
MRIQSGCQPFSSENPYQKLKTVKKVSNVSRRYSTEPQMMITCIQNNIISNTACKVKKYVEDVGKISLPAS